MISTRFLEKDRATQERWFRMKLHKKFSRRIHTLFLWRLHRKLNKEFYIREKTINEAIDSVVSAHKKVDSKLFPATKEFFNIALYFLLAERDVQALKADAFCHPNETKRNIALRTLLLTIYEWDMSKVTGRKMKFIYDVSSLSDNLKSGLAKSLKDLRSARKSVQRNFSETRHNTIAHREPDAFLQHEIIFKLDIRKHSAEITKFYEASNKVLSYLTLSTQEVSTMTGLFRQILNNRTKA
ncbi:hypothetical protein EDC38_0454 [Marinimicrobium koreense]|uniref:Uncharacterized protein n=1 Tax=Marinimicrobium koreense TaxID=306545 RepID=A0A3N1NUM9_9GAMM|nr:hypothetical protein [Marinimicrobium koreense]ROQ19863.1 hypothetical protein EDC38_0454 [Marinimicrobium koreense]